MKNKTPFLMPVLSETEECEILHDQSKWSVVITDSFASHKYNFKASSHLSIAVMYGILIAALKLFGYKAR